MKHKKSVLVKCLEYFIKIIFILVNCFICEYTNSMNKHNEIYQNEFMNLFIFMVEI